MLFGNERHRFIAALVPLFVSPEEKPGFTAIGFI